MGIFQQFPYSNFHEMNLDQIIKIMREMQDEWVATKAEWASYKDFIDNYFANLNLDEETERALRRLIADGTLDAVIDPVIAAEVAAWLAEHIEPTTPAIDGSLTVAGAGADAKVTGDYLAGVVDTFAGIASFEHNLINNKKNNLIDFNGLIKNGYINGTTGAFVFGASSTGLDCCTPFIKVTPATQFVLVSLTDPATNVRFNIVEYDKDRQFITGRIDNSANYIQTLQNTTEYIRVSFNSSITDFDKTDVYIRGSVPNILVQHAQWRNGSLGNTASTIAVASRDIIPNKGATSFGVVVNSDIPAGYHLRIQISTYSVAKGSTGSNSSNRITRDKTIVTDEKFAFFTLKDGSLGFGISIYLADDLGGYAPLNIDNFDTGSVNVIRKYDSIYSALDYIVDAGFNKHAVSMVRIPGTLSGIQAFCKYMDKYYSTNGTNLYEQDATLTLLSTTEINAGHGNSIQLGNNGFAYVSGWDDDKIYKINLASKTVSDVITLPVSGYTTGVVDDINNIVYMFHRTSSPSTPDNYNFIAYDYVNNVTLLQKKTCKSFAALQACDFKNGRIFAVNGLGTDGAPNGYCVYNTSGDIIAEYVLGSITTEPEGVFIDRDNNDLYISDVDGRLYMITPTV